MSTIFTSLRALRSATLSSAQAACEPQTRAHAVAESEPTYQRWSCANCAEHRTGPEAKGITGLAIVSVLFGLTLLAMSMPIGGLFLVAAVLAPQRQPAMRCDICKCGKFWTVSKKQAEAHDARFGSHA